MSYHTQIVGAVCCATHDLKAIKLYHLLALGLTNHKPLYGVSSYK